MPSVERNDIGAMRGDPIADISELTSASSVIKPWNHLQAMIVIAYIERSGIALLER